MKNKKIYAVKDETTNKFVSDLTSRHKKYWDVRTAAENAIREALRWRPYLKLKVVAFELVEVSDND